jgi:hypothetical protein
VAKISIRLVGILHGCLKTGTTYHEHTAWDHHTKPPLDNQEPGMSAAVSTGGPSVRSCR